MTDKNNLHSGTFCILNHFLKLSLKRVFLSVAARLIANGKQQNQLNNWNQENNRLEFVPL